MPRFRAHVVLTFDAPSLTDGGARMRDLASAASEVGFELERGHVEHLPPEEAEEGEEAGGWTSYGPLVDG